MANFMVHPINVGVLVHHVVKSIINELFFKEKLLFYIIDNYNN